MTAIRNGLIELFGVRRVDPVEHPRKNRARENYEVISELAERAIIGVPVAYLQRKAPLLFAAVMLQALSLTAFGFLTDQRRAHWLGKRVIVMQLDAGLLNVARLGQLQLAQSKGNPQQALIFSIMSIISLVALAFHDLDPGAVPLSDDQSFVCRDWQDKLHVLGLSLSIHQASLEALNSRRASLTDSMLRHLDEASEILNASFERVSVLERQYAEIAEEGYRSFEESQYRFNESLQGLDADRSRIQHSLALIDQLVGEAEAERRRADETARFRQQRAEEARQRRAEEAARVARSLEERFAALPGSLEALRTLFDQRLAAYHAVAADAAARNLPLSVSIDGALVGINQSFTNLETGIHTSNHSSFIQTMDQDVMLRNLEGLETSLSNLQLNIDTTIGNATDSIQDQIDSSERLRIEEEDRVSTALAEVTLIPIGKYTDWDLEILRVRLEQMSHSGAKLKYSIMEKRYEAHYNPVDGKLTIHTADASQDTASAHFLMVEFDAEGQVIKKEPLKEHAREFEGEHLTALEGAIDAALISKMEVSTSGTVSGVPSSIRVVREGIQRISREVLRKFFPRILKGNLSASFDANFFNNQLVGEGSLDEGGPRRYFIEQIMAGLSGGMAGEIAIARGGIFPEPMAKWGSRFATDPALIPEMGLEERETYEHMGSLMYALYLDNTLVGGQCFSENLFHGVKLFSSEQLRKKFTELTAEERAEIAKSYFKVIGEAILEKRWNAFAKRTRLSAGFLPSVAHMDSEQLDDSLLSNSEKAPLPAPYVGTAPLEKLQKRDIIAAFQSTDAYMSALLVATSKEDPKIEDLEEEHRWVALCLIDGEVSNIGKASKVDPDKVREHWGHIQSEIRLDSTRDAMAVLAPLHAIAYGMLDCATHRSTEQDELFRRNDANRVWENDFRSKPTQEIMREIQGVLSREKVIEALRFEKEGAYRGDIPLNSDSEPPRQRHDRDGSIYRRDCETLKKAKWIREWLADENDCTELYLKKFVTFVAGSSSLPVDKKITISGKRQAQALPNSHTCSFNIEVASSPCGTMDASGRLREDLLNDHTKEAFIHALKTALDNQEFSEG